MIVQARVLAAAALIALAALAALPASASASLWPPQTVTLTMTNRGGERTVPSNVAVWPDQPVVVVVRNYTRHFHTFTIRALGVSALIYPATGTTPRVTRVEFRSQHHGVVVTWACVICPTGVHGSKHAMGGRIYSITP